MPTLLALALMATNAHASSHREAPGIALDPAADLTDFYAFVSPEDPSKVVFILNVQPLEAPGGGPNFHRFDDDVFYKIHVDNEGDGLEDVTFGFQFHTYVEDDSTFLYNVGSVADPATLNVHQSMIAARWDDGVGTRIYARKTNPWMVAPANVGVVSVPAGGYAPESSTPGTLTQAAILVDGDTRIFAGPRQEGFYVDLERTFDLLNLGNPDNTNTLLGYNVHSIAIEVPITSLTRDGMPAMSGSGNEVIAAWATTERRRTTNRYSGGADISTGDWVQVARLGNPLVNEAVIGLGDKDRFNRSQPADDIQFLGYVTNPLLPVYMDLILGIPDPGPHDEGLGIGGREDLVLAFLTGHPALGTMPAGYSLGGAIPGEPGKVFGAYEALRMNLTTSSGFPNGRFVSDDVTDVALSAMAGLLINGTTVSDGVDATGLHYLDTFPWLGDPWAGDDHPAGYHDLP